MTIEQTIKLAQAIVELDKRPVMPNGRDLTCPECKTGTFTGTFLYSCDNPQCVLYDDFVMSRCGICGAVRRDCCC